MTLVDDAARRAATQDLDRNLFVEAGAGAGKTALLVERVLALVEAGVPIESIAAITFTEAAGAELRYRIRARLEAAGTLNANLALDGLDRAAVGTLHSFAQRLLRTHATRVGLPPVFEVLDEVRSQLAFDERFGRFWRSLVDDERYERLVLTAFALGVTADQIKALAATLDDHWDRVDLVERPDPDPRPLDLAPVLTAVEAVLDCREVCLADGDRLAEFVDERVGALRERLDRCEDELDQIAVVVESTERFRSGNRGTAANWPAGAKDGCHEAIRRLSDALAAASAGAKDDVVRRLAGRVADEVGRAATARCAAGTLQFHDLLVLARRLLTTDAEAHRDLRRRYTRLLLDEFQDTDPLQIELAVALAAPVPPAGSWEEATVDPGRVFLVGDPKQSIYRFRRADIALFRRASRSAVVDDRPTLVTNFRSVPGIVEWVNAVFAGLLVDDGSDAQAPFAAMHAHRSPGPGRVPVTTVGGPLPELRAAELRAVEAGALAAVVEQAVREGWPVGAEGRPARYGDVTILVPARTSVPQLLDALEARDVPVRVQTDALLYSTEEVREVLNLLRAVDDPTDEISIVGALRSALFGCGDDDLVVWHGLGGRFSYLADPPDGSAEHPVGRALARLRVLHGRRHWLSPSELCELVMREFEVFALALEGDRSRDVWRRLRFLHDRVRAFVDSAGGDLRDVVDWLSLQAVDGTRVSEPVLPETDDDAVSLMTIHAAKGLEFPITVVAGMSTQLRRGPIGVQVLWPDGRAPEISLGRRLSSVGFADDAVAETVMDEAERRRLLYVAATRAEDHLVVSLHHKAGGSSVSYGKLLWEAATAGDDVIALADHVEAASGEPLPFGAPPRPAGPPVVPDLAAWRARRSAALERHGPLHAVSATALTAGLADDDGPGGGRGPWQRGRSGTAVGRAVHGVLQVLDLGTGEGLAALAAAQAAAEGIDDLASEVVRAADSIRRAPVVRRAVAAGSRCWRELLLAATVEGRTVEGYLDLLIETAPGHYVVVDYKTDAVVGEAAADDRVRHYRFQGATYELLVERALQGVVDDVVFVFAGPDGPVERSLFSLADRAGLRAELVAGL